MIEADEVWADFLAGLDEVRHDPGASAETIHRVRSSASRLCAWLELGGHRTLRDDLRWVRRRAAPVRDADVALARGLPPAMANWLAVERLHRRTDFADAIALPRFGALRLAVPLLPPVPRADAERATKAIERRVARRGEAVTGDAPGEAVHRLRRAVRRLRNARDWLGVPSGSLRPTLDAFGEMTDAAAVLRLAETCPDRAVPAEFTAELRADLDASRLRAIEAWRRAEWR